jgi:hypothetical protein
MKKLCNISIAFIFIFLFASCQTTPEELAVVGKGDGLLKDKIEAPAREGERFETPARLRIEPFGEAHFQIEVDASVVVPDTTNFPVAEIEKRLLTEEWAKNVMLIMAEGKPVMTYETEVPQTKKEILPQISMIQEILVNPDDYYGEVTDEETRSQLIADLRVSLQQWEEAYRKAPDVFEETEIDFSYVFGEMRGAVDFGKKRKTYLSVMGYPDAAGGRVEFNNLDDGVGLPFHFDMKSDFTNMNDITITKDTAVKTGLDYLEKLGETGFAPAQISAGYCDPRGDSALAIHEYPQCYQIMFTRSVEGVLTTYRESKNDVLMSGYSTEKLEENSRYAYFFPQEYFEMVIRDSGVNYMMWEMPAIQTAVLNENVALESFETIIERFKKQILFESHPLMEEDPSIIKKTLVIDRIELGMMQVRKKDAMNSLLMVPAWSFFGRIVVQYTGPQPGGYTLNENNEYVDEVPGTSYMTINAIDGSIINPMFGF